MANLLNFIICTHKF